MSKSKTTQWLDDWAEYYQREPNEIIYAHTLVEAMEAINADLEQVAAWMRTLTELPGEHKAKTRASNDK